MTRHFFDEQMARMSGLRFMPTDLTTHWEALSDLPSAVLDAAVGRAQKTRSEFPTPVELRQDADQAAPRTAVAEIDRGTDLPAPIEYSIPHVQDALKITREWNYYCERCNDGGWESFFCGAQGDPLRTPWWEYRTCDRRGQHAGHEWVTPCGCLEWNPEIKRRKDLQAKYAVALVKK